MPNYKRRYRPGGTFFFTVMLNEGVGISLLTHLDKLRAAYARTHAEQPFQTDAIVVLPDHLHCVWTLPPGDTDYALRWRKIKSRLTRDLAPMLLRSQSQIARSEQGLWQRRFWEHEIRDQDDFNLYIAYTLTDPVRHGLVMVANDWVASSIHRDVRQHLAVPKLPALPVSLQFEERREVRTREPA